MEWGYGSLRCLPIVALAIVVLLPAPEVASAAKCPGGETDPYKYVVRTQGHNGGSTTLDGAFSNSSLVRFSYVYKAKLRVCKSLGAIKVKRDRAETATARSSGEFLVSRDPQTGAEQRCAWAEDVTIDGPLRLATYDFGRNTDFKPRWAFVFSQGIGLDSLLAEAYFAVLKEFHSSACGADGPAMVSTDGVDSRRVGKLVAYAPAFGAPGIVIDGEGNGDPPPALTKLVNGKDVRLDTTALYPNHPTGSYVEHGEWRVMTEFERRG